MLASRQAPTALELTFHPGEDLAGGGAGENRGAPARQVGRGSTPIDVRSRLDSSVLQEPRSSLSTHAFLRKFCSNGPEGSYVISWETPKYKPRCSRRDKSLTASWWPSPRRKGEIWRQRDSFSLKFYK